MKKIILALACAFSVIVAKASDSPWFSGSASGKELTKTNADWSHPDSGVEVAEGVITLDLDTNERMTLTPTETAPDAETKTSVNVTAYFYPNALGDLDTPAADTQTALAVAYETEKGPLSYYAWDGKVWVALSGAMPVAEGATEVTAKIELDYYRSGTKARFTIEGTVLSYTDANKTTQTWLPLDTQSREVNNVAFAGSGKLRSVASTVEIGVASVDGVKYPTYAAAIEAAKVNGVLNKVVTILHESAGETLGAGALADYKAAGNQIVAKVYVARIGDTKYETLAEAVAAYTTGSRIIVLDQTVVDIPAGWTIKDGELIQVGIVVDGEVGTGSEKTFILAVPKSTTPLTAATLINTANRVEGDQLKVYVKSAKSYYSWQLVQLGDTLVWDPLKVIVATDAGQSETDSPAADTIQLTDGQGVWVTVKDDSKTVLLNGQYAGAEDTVEVELETGWNLVAPLPKAEAFNLNELEVTDGEFCDNDMIVIPGAAAPINCVRKDNAWKVYTPKVEDGTNAPEGWGKIATEATWEAAPTIPAGKGFFFVSDGKKTLEL